MRAILTFTLTLLLTSCSHHSPVSSIQTLPVEDVQWQKLNEARGDKSPQAATLWGNRYENPETGFLAKFVDGFSSPPHIHNVSYRAIVIEGLVHNDDPDAAPMWMPNGSYWTQPAGEAHITSAKGTPNIALVEVDYGPYLVRPVDSSFNNGERPFNIHYSNILWEEKKGIKKVKTWKNKAGTVGGLLIKFSEKLKIKPSQARIVGIRGVTELRKQQLNPGSLVTVDVPTILEFSCKSEECIVYLKSDQSFKTL